MSAEPNHAAQVESSSPEGCRNSEPANRLREAASTGARTINVHGKECASLG
jgi:hypothetical protein